MHSPFRSRCELVVALTALLTACADSAAPTRILGSAPVLSTAATEAEGQILDMMDAANLALATTGAPYRFAIAEYITTADGEAIGATLLARDLGNKRLTADFVPLDPRRTWSGPATGPSDDITFAIDQTGDAVPFAGGLTGAQTTAAIRRAMGTWDGASCSDLPLREIITPIDLNSFSFGGPVVADIQHAGWRDIDFTGGVLAATITAVFVAGAPQVPTDIDGNGLADVALREIYYDPFVTLPTVPRVWLDNGGDIDVESVALHESGHGLSQGHFGNIFAKRGFLAASPLAVMNAVYGGVQRSLRASDNGGHCSNWADWPNR